MHMGVIKTFLFVAILLVTGLFLYGVVKNFSEVPPLPQTGDSITATSSEDKPPHEKGVFEEPITIVARGLEIPWDVAFLPDESLLVTERPGRLSRIFSDGTKKSILVSGVKTGGEGGLLGLMLHPAFEKNQLLYLYLSAPSSGGRTQNRVERHRLSGDVLLDKKTIIEGIPGALYHDGGRMEFGPDGMFYITTGDATDGQLAQDISSLAGKILRLTSEGEVPKDNPFGNAVYSYGHRNPQGITWDEKGNLWSTEHGRSGLLSGFDELNMIEKGKNYGWPIIEGDAKKESMLTPVLHSGADVTWAPASAAFYKGSVFFGGLKGETLYEAVLSDTGKVSVLKKYFIGEYGRLRTARVGPDGMLYVTTSNRDDRGDAREGDDKIIRINPAFLK